MAVRTRKNKVKKEKIVLIVFSLLILCALFFLYLFKYKNQNLRISEFNLLLTGNLLNLTFSVILAILLMYSAFSKKKLIDYKLLLVSLILMLSFLTIGAVSTYYPKGKTSTYMFDHPINEVFTGFFFSAYQFVQFFIISLFWNTIIGRKTVIILRSVVQSIFIIVFLYVFAFFFSYSTENFRETTSIGNKNLAVVLGAAVWKNNIPSPSLARRVDKAMELYKKGVVSKVLLTGGNAPGELSEAETALKYVKDKHEPVDNIIIENNTTSTNEQIQFVKSHFSTSPDFGKILIISDIYHLPRINEICKFHNLNFLLQASDLELSFEKKIFYKIRESTGLLIFWFFSL